MNELFHIWNLSCFQLIKWEYMLKSFGTYIVMLSKRFTVDLFFQIENSQLPRELIFRFQIFTNLWSIEYEKQIVFTAFKQDLANWHRGRFIVIDEVIAFWSCIFSHTWIWNIKEIIAMEFITLIPLPESYNSDLIFVFQAIVCCLISF